MSYFISLTAIFMAVFALKYFTKQKEEILFPLVNLSIILLLYIFGLCQILFIGGFIVLFSILTLFIISVIHIFRSGNKQFFKQFLSPTIIVMAVFSFVQFFALINMRVISHDELTHWGLVVKNMFYHRNFGGGSSATTMFKGYPVGSSLFLYFFEMFGTSFIDAYLYMAMNLLNVSLLLPLASKFENIKQKFAFSFLLIGTAFIFNYRMFFSIWNDQFLSISFAFILISYFCFISEKGLPKINFISMLLATFVLISSKSSGLIFVIFAYLIIGLDLLINRRALIKKNYKTSILTSVCVLLAILIPKISWSIYLNFIEVGGAWQTNQLTVKNIFKYCFAPNKFQSKVTKNFLYILISPFANAGNNASIKIPVILEFLLLFVLIFMIQKKKSNKEAKVLYISIFLTFIAYLIGLLFSYVFTFQESEALGLASFVRYTNTYVLGIVLFLLAYYCSMCKQLPKREPNRRFVSLIIYGIVLIGFVMYPLLTTLINDNAKQFDKFSEYISQLDKSDRVYIIHCYSHSHDVVKDYLQMRFIATPLDTSGLKIGGSPHIGDMWNKDMDINQLTTAIIEGNYNYLYIHNFEDNDLQQYETLFTNDIQTKTMYKIINNNDVITFE